MRAEVTRARHCQTVTQNIVFWKITGESTAINRHASCCLKLDDSTCFRQRVYGAFIALLVDVVQFNEAIDQAVVWIVRLRRFCWSVKSFKLIGNTIADGDAGDVLLLQIHHPCQRQSGCLEQRFHIDRKSFVNGGVWLLGIGEPRFKCRCGSPKASGELVGNRVIVPFRSSADAPYQTFTGVCELRLGGIHAG
jgi:hypothetical protein